MRRLTTIRLALGVGLVLTIAAAPAAAGKLDLSLARFVTCHSPAHCEPQIAEYERFMAEYAFGLAPKTMGPASTLGYSGFYLGLEGSLTPVPDDGKKTADDRWYKGTAPLNQAPGVMFVPAVRIRKGLPWSMELGSTVNYMAQSETVALGGDLKWSLFEGYREGFRGALPDVAARGSVVRILGQGDIDMTIIGVDGAISYPFGLGGMLSLTPFGGFQYLWTILRIEPLIHRDEDDRFHTGEGGFYDVSGLPGPNLERIRLFLGFQLKYELLSIIFEGAWGLARKWDTAVDDRPGLYPEEHGIHLDRDQMRTEVGHQFQFSGGVGLDF